MPGTKGFRYVYSQGHITKALEKIRTTGHPDKLTFSYMRDTWLLRNKQYTEVIALLKDMQFLSEASVPTELYAEYTNPGLAKQALARGIRNAYPQLFKAYPDAHSLTREELSGYFRQQTGKAGSTLNMMLATFQGLCSQTDFGGDDGIAGKPEPVKKQAKGEPETRVEPRVKVEPGINLNIEIHIAADTPDDKIEKIFKNMRTYLLPDG